MALSVWLEQWRTEKWWPSKSSVRFAFISCRNHFSHNGRMKKDFKTWEECLNLREVKVCVIIIMCIMFHLITKTVTDEAETCQHCETP